MPWPVVFQSLQSPGKTHHPTTPPSHYQPPTNLPKIQRHKACEIARVTASKPVRLAVEAGFFQPETTYFDYGCGHGADIEYIHRMGLPSSGWDPYFRPDVPRTQADVVNLGYVINVIEDTAERREALINAWDLAQKGAHRRCPGADR